MKVSKPLLWVVIGLAILVIAGAAYWLISEQDESQAPAAAGLASYETMGVNVAVATVPETPRVGENRLIVELKDAEGEPLSNVNIKAHAEMPAMGAMPAMRAPADLREVRPGRYEGLVELSMRGEWPLTITFDTPDGTEARLQFDLATDRPGLDIAAGATRVEPAANGRNGGVDTDDDLQRYRAGELEIAVTTDPETPRVGTNQLIVDIRHANGDPFPDIAVEAFAEMPAMGAMPAMRAPADLEQVAAGRFEGAVDLSMRGEWPLTIRIQNPQGADHQLKFDLATDREGLALAAGATPVGQTAGEPSAGGEPSTGPMITIDSRRRQMIGVETAQAEVRDLVRGIRAVGEVTYDERLLSEIALKFDGYIGDLYADYVGATVKEGQALFTVYSPELLAAQQEYLEVQRRGGSEGSLLQAARQRLLLWDMSPAEIESLQRSGTPEPYISILAPRTGTVIELNVADGSAASRGTPVMKIADLSRVWVDAQVYEADLSLLHEGMTTSVSLPYLPDRRYSATLEYIYPFLAAQSRTGRVRMALDNESGELRPAMYAEVTLDVALEDRLTVPEEAVLVAGTSRVVFVDLGQGRLQAVRIQTGRRAQGYIEVLEGLEPGATVVTSGNFLIAAETRLKTGIEQW